MDNWMVAVAAGAGHIAQHFKKFKQNGAQITSESSSSFNTSLNNKPSSPNQHTGKKCPFRRSIKRNNWKQDDSATNVTSTSESDTVNGVISRNCEGNNVFSPSTLFPSTSRSRMLLRNRRGAMKPLTSLESCYMAQLHFDHVEMKEYMGSPFASPSSKTIRPFLVTDGSKVINRSSGGTFIGSSETMIGNDSMLHVCIGMSFGILYSFMTHKREVEKLNRLLKHTESLVQDLEEELEMKDSLTMQELTISDHKSQITDDVSPHNKELSVIQKEKDESYSKIEKELEAELEMLEMNMTSSTLERRISDLFEVDPDFEPGMAHGELRAADMALDNRNQDESGRSTTETPSANYAVSPRELSLRLHELLQSQLEERIKELEAEIESKKTQNHNKSWKEVSSGDEIENPNNPVDDEPVVLNLLDEALDAYNEACNEFAKFDDDDDDSYEDDENGTPVDGREDDDKDFDEDEMEKMLIKHIVEKARQGSPMVLNAQRALFSESIL